MARKHNSQQTLNIHWKYVWNTSTHKKYPTKKTPEAPTSVIGVAGSPVNLPCNITPPGEEEDAEDAIALVLWYKDESTTPIYSLDARQGSLDQARHAAKEGLGTRARLSISERPAFLKLDPVLMDDEGEYKCRADFKKARTRYMSVILKVVVPPGKPAITDQNKEVLQSLIGPYNEGEPLVLICDVIGGQPLPAVTWWRESVLLDDSYDVIKDDHIRNELLISTLQRHDLMAVFTCQASNNNVSLPASASVTVDMNCQPLPAVTWWRESVLLDDSYDVIKDDHIRNELLISTLQRHDLMAVFTCQASNNNVSLPASASVTVDMNCK
ncbi:synaptogenesis protein syg-2-like [Uloborus diversus]|uniref:synaptogenesis protein syg-2-like n=1 Tax=Uloborus diversus TaxID=327109 RepID=UPI00240950D6|nr:synaptogenesis protein syg-2-like [Uloborus diversus]